ncbi:hypothetical protein F2Q69_00037374 [Brassica cretica]|uniref:Uncharacterized protein n=1 Tax=Brassica cretica TaxID=69181 RepID=A0A8S9SVX5_BRACR|nr:hypothetical protein F2Q69_00037374 [Brassica cretica]
MVNEAEEANMQVVAGGEINDGVIETPNNYVVPPEFVSYGSDRGRLSEIDLYFLVMLKFLLNVSFKSMFMYGMDSLLDFSIYRIFGLPSLLQVYSDVSFETSCLSLECVVIMMLNFACVVLQIRSRLCYSEIDLKFALAAITNHQASSSNTMRRRGGRIRKKNLSEEELIERKRHVKMVSNLRKTEMTTERKQLLSTYLKNKKRIERLTISIQLNTDRKGKPTSFFNVRKWEREKAASESIVHHIEVNNFKKKKKTPTHIYFE